MNKVRIVCVGKLKEGYWREACAEYEKRLSRFCSLEIVELPERRTLEEEGEEIAKKLKGKVFVLASEGKQRTSVGFSSLLGNCFDAGEEVTFVIGSSCGLIEDVKKRADELVSFSELTFPHQMMRVILLEQIYRACMIRAGAEYHK